MKRILPYGYAWAASIVLVARCAAADPMAESPVRDAVPAEEQAPAEMQTEAAHADVAPPSEPLEQESALDVEPLGEADELAVDPAPPEPPRVEPVAPPPLAPVTAPAAPAPRRGPLGLSAGATRTLGWVTVAVSAAASIGLTTAGIAVCQGQGPGCMQGQPLIWSGAAIGLAGIPIGFTLVVRGKQLSLAGPIASVPLPSVHGRQF